MGVHGQVARACGKVLLVELSLRSAWSLDRYTFGKPQGQQRPGNDNDEHYTDIGLANSAITSDEFWAYARMIDAVAETADVIMSWGESCPCHWRHEGFEGPSRHDPKRAMAHQWRRQRDGSCPLAGMRAAELAAGALSERLTLLWEVSHANLCLLPGMLRWSPGARGKVLDDFARARRHFRFTLAVKASFWRQLPWQLFGLSHHDAEVARVCAQRCLELFDASLSQVKSHWLVDGLCRPGSPGFHQVQQFVAGSQLVELPLLESLVARFKFVSVVERWIEGWHAVVKNIFWTDPMRAPCIWVSC